MDITTGDPRVSESGLHETGLDLRDLWTGVLVRFDKYLRPEDRSIVKTETTVNYKEIT